MSKHTHIRDQTEIEYCNGCELSATRNRLTNELIPVNVEHSKTKGGNEEKYAAARAIDLDLKTKSYTEPGTSTTSWLRVDLGDLKCVQKVVQYKSDGGAYRTWTCSNKACSCKGYYCKHIDLIVFSEETSSDGLSHIASCIYGDVVKLQRTSSFDVYEIAITGKQGEICRER